MRALVFIGIVAFWACVGLLILAIFRINKKIEDDTTVVEIETARLVELELRAQKEAH